MEMFTKEGKYKKIFKEEAQKYYAEIGCYVYADSPEEAKEKADKYAKIMEKGSGDDIWAFVTAIHTKEGIRRF